MRSHVRPSTFPSESHSVSGAQGNFAIQTIESEPQPANQPASGCACLPLCANQTKQDEQTNATSGSKKLLPNQLPTRHQPRACLQEAVSAIAPVKGPPPGRAPNLFGVYVCTASGSLPEGGCAKSAQTSDRQRPADPNRDALLLIHSFAALAGPLGLTSFYLSGKLATRDNNHK